MPESGNGVAGWRTTGIPPSAFVIPNNSTAPSPTTYRKYIVTLGQQREQPDTLEKWDEEKEMEQC
jgi:hypothetical protein